MMPIAKSRTELRTYRREQCGDILKAWRTEKGIGTIKLASITGLDRRYIQRVEAGVIDPTATTLKLLCNALDCC
jgi:transcriptional regulator with XRE-family HTH domain